LALFADDAASFADLAESFADLAAEFAADVLLAAAALFAAAAFALLAATALLTAAALLLAAALLAADAAALAAALAALALAADVSSCLSQAAMDKAEMTAAATSALRVKSDMFRLSLWLRDLSRPFQNVAHNFERLGTPSPQFGVCVVGSLLNALQ
jgi:hypothetical protein